MKLNHTTPFEFEGKSYEIRIYSAGWKFNIRAYLENKPANAYSYNVELPTFFDIKRILNIDVIQESVEMAKKDIENKTWKKHVNCYLEKIKITENNQLGCQNCTSRNIESIIVDSRKMYECKKCDNVWYGIVTSYGPCDAILYDITNDVEKKGESEIFTEVLVNTVFREDSHEGLSTQDQLKNWANINKLEYELFDKKDALGKKRQAIRFHSKVPRVSPPFPG